jgi:hypothetical protein
MLCRSDFVSRRAISAKNDTTAAVLPARERIAVAIQIPNAIPTTQLGQYGGWIRRLPYQEIAAMDRQPTIHVASWAVHSQTVQQLHRRMRWRHHHSRRSAAASARQAVDGTLGVQGYRRCSWPIPWVDRSPSQ